MIINKVRYHLMLCIVINQQEKKIIVKYLNCCKHVKYCVVRIRVDKSFPGHNGVNYYDPTYFGVGNGDRVEGA